MDGNSKAFYMTVVVSDENIELTNKKPLKSNSKIKISSLFQFYSSFVIKNIHNKNNNNIIIVIMSCFSTV